MMKRLKTALAVMVVVLSGCAVLGVPPADTFNKRVVVANGIVEQVSRSVETLFVAGKLSQADAQQYNERAENAATGIDAAVQVHATDPTGADAKLSAIITALNILKAELEKRQ